MNIINVQDLNATLYSRLHTKQICNKIIVNIAHFNTIWNKKDKVFKEIRILLGLCP
jgi:hypothetical protein